MTILADQFLRYSTIEAVRLSSIIDKVIIQHLIASHAGEALRMIIFSISDGTFVQDRFQALGALVRITFRMKFPLESIFSIFCHEFIADHLATASALHVVLIVARFAFGPLTIRSNVVIFS